MLAVVVFSPIGYVFWAAWIALGIFVAVDAGKYPDAAFRQTGSSRSTWQIWPIVLAVVCGLGTLIMAIIWLTSKRTAVQQAAAGPYGGYGYGGPPGYAQQPGYPPPPGYPQQPYAPPPGPPPPPGAAPPAWGAPPPPPPPPSAAPPTWGAPAPPPPAAPPPPTAAPPTWGTAPPTWGTQPPIAPDEPSPPENPSQ